MLFFVLALVAAYTNRSMVFEQRTSGNQYRSTQALEAADAGMEWALAMLNSGRIDDQCAPTADATQQSFRRRLLQIDDVTGTIQPDPADADDNGTAWPTCVHDGAAWRCHCPGDGAGSPKPPDGLGVFPAFRVRFASAAAAGPGLVELEVNGCTRLDDECLRFPARGVAGEGRASLRVLIALRSALPGPPVAAITVRGDLDAEGEELGAFNPDPASGGLAILTGGELLNPGGLRLAGPAGTAPEESVRRAPAMSLEAIPDADKRPPRFFEQTFAAALDTYRNQPATVELDCTGGCNADRVRAAAERHPDRILWARGGPVNLAPPGVIGSADEPVLLVVPDGAVALGVQMHGLIYGAGGGWTGDGTLRGALIDAGDFAGGATFDVVRDAAVLDRLRWRTGSFVRVPGGWRDYR